MVHNVGVTEGLFEDDVTFVNDRNHAARLLGFTYLVFEPLRNIVEGGFQPVVHELHLFETYGAHHLGRRINARVSRGRKYAGSIRQACRLQQRKVQLQPRGIGKPDFA